MPDGEVDEEGTTMREEDGLKLLGLQILKERVGMAVQDGNRGR